MGLRMVNVILTPRGRTTSIYSPDGINWFTEDDKPVPLHSDGRPIVFEDNVGADLIGIIFVISLIFGICWLFGLIG